MVLFEMSTDTRGMFFDLPTLYVLRRVLRCFLLAGGLYLELKKLVVLEICWTFDILGVVVLGGGTGAIDVGAIVVGAIDVGAIVVGAIVVGAIDVGAIVVGAIDVGAIVVGA
jgi:hypothetical protein